MFCAFGVCSGLNIYLYTNRKSSTYLALCVVNGVFASVWIAFSLLNIWCYKKWSEANGGEYTRGDIEYTCGDIGSPFVVEQIQQYVSEICAYPQLCMSIIYFWQEMTIISVALLAIPSVIGLLVYITRIVTIIKLRRYLRVILKRLLFSLIGNYFVTMGWLAVVLFYSYDFETGLIIRSNLIPQLTISGFILIANTWNTVFFYTSYLYDFSLQAAFTTGDRPTAEHLSQLPPFHKTMYAMSVPKYGALGYFWAAPYAAIVVLYFLYPPVALNFTTVPIHFILFTSVLVLSLIINCRPVAVCLISHGTPIFIIGVIATTLLASGLIMMVVVVSIALFILYHCIWCLNKCCKCCSKWDYRQTGYTYNKQTGEYFPKYDFVCL